MGESKNNEVQKMFTELANYERKGVDITINGLSASPMQVVQAHMLRENVAYMRDYQMNEKGDIRRVDFLNVEA